MTDNQPTLDEFLLARISDDEAYARNAFAGHNDAKPEWNEIWSGALDLGDEDLLITNDSQVSRHIERWDPARVLAECEAKRGLVRDATEVPTTSMRRALKWLALPYASHPDYQQEWRP